MTDTDGETRLMTYGELAEARGISRRSAMRLVFREGWARTKGNDGQARVAVPTAAIASRQDGAPTARRNDSGHSDSHNGAAFTAALDAVREAHAGHVAAMTATIAAQGQVIASGEVRIRELEARVSELEGELTAERAKSEGKGDETYRLEEIKSRVSFFGNAAVGLFITGIVAPALLVLGRGREGGASWWDLVAMAVPYAMAMGCLQIKELALRELKTNRPARRSLLSRWRRLRRGG